MIKMLDYTFEYLLNIADELDIKVVQRFSDKSGNPLPSNMPSASDSEKHKIILNMNWYNPQEIPLMLAHELSHVINGDTGICYYTSVSTIKTEASANKLAIKMLIDYFFAEAEPEYINVCQFMNYYCIPSEFYEFICSYIQNKYEYEATY